MSIKLFLIIILITNGCAQKNPNFVQNRNVILHLNQWKYSDIAEECERYLQNTSFGGIQVSPPNENVIVTGRPWSERYQPVSYNLTTRSGTESELTDMILRCNKLNLRIYVDVVLNHMSAQSGIGTAGNTAFADMKTYPGVPYLPQNFHPTCTIDSYVYPNVVRTCELDGLRDLDQSSDVVLNKIVNFMNHLIDLGVAGFRIDSAKYINPTDLKILYKSLNNLNVKFGFSTNSIPFIFQDVPIFDDDVIGTEEYTPIGTVLEPIYSKTLSRIFHGITPLANLTNFKNFDFIPNSSDSVTYINDFRSQTNEEILSYKNLKQYKMALSFMLAHSYGIPTMLSSYFFDSKEVGPPMDSSEIIKSPIIYEDGSCGNGYVCEHRWPQIASMIEFKRIVDGTEIENWWSNENNTNQIAFSRGNKGFIAFTNNGTLNQAIATLLSPGIYCDIISGALLDKKCTGRTVEVHDDGTAGVLILESDYDGVLAIHENSRL